jgi:hypothetical protein
MLQKMHKPAKTSRMFTPEVYTAANHCDEPRSSDSTGGKKGKEDRRSNHHTSDLDGYSVCCPLLFLVENSTRSKTAVALHSFIEKTLTRETEHDCSLCKDAGSESWNQQRMIHPRYNGPWLLSQRKSPRSGTIGTASRHGGQYQ